LAFRVGWPRGQLPVGRLNFPVVKSEDWRNGEGGGGGGGRERNEPDGPQVHAQLFDFRTVIFKGRFAFFGELATDRVFPKYGKVFA
jgi:hypothetical protein